MPPELAGKVRGVLFDDAVTLTRWRSWRSTDLKYIDAQAKTGRCAAIELYRTEFSDGSGGGNYGKRTRPSAAYIARTCGAVLVEAGR